MQLQTLENKLKTEIHNLQEKIDKARAEVVTYSNLNELKDEAERKRKELMEKKQNFLETQDSIKNELANVRREYEKIQVTSCKNNVSLYKKFLKYEITIVN